ncbi:MAG TPA: NUDIX hydrolase [Vampirovibrionales bacterium]
MNTNTQNLEEKQLSTRLVHRGNVVDLTVDQVELPNGKRGEREVVLHNGGVVIVPQLETGQFILVKQYRYAIQSTLFEFPAGRLEIGENPAQAAIRELEEETGYCTNKLEHLGDIYTAPGFCSEKLNIYLATELEFKKQNLDEDEFLEVFVMSQAELMQKVKQQEITDAKTLAAMSMLALR